MIITGSYLLTGDRETVIENGAVAVKGKTILAVGTLDEIKAKYPDDEVKEYKGMTIMPGLIDLHNHIAYTWGTPNQYIFDTYPMTRAMFATKRMKDTLLNGVTTIRDVASADHIGTALTYGAKFGYIDAPRIFTSGKGILITGGHGWSLKDGVVECDGEWEVRKAVRTNIRDGANYIKILTSEGYRGEEMNQDEINAAVDEAHRFGVRVASHAGYDPSIKMSIDGGCDTIEHGTHLTMEEALQMKEHDQTWVPTIYCFFYAYEQTKAACPDDESFLAAHGGYLLEATECYKNDFKKLYDAGVRIACGTDTDCCDHPEAAPVYMECRYMVDCGITPLQAIECATKNGAEALGCGDKFGMLKEGLSADIIAVDGKPFENIDDLHNVKAVYLEGVQKV